MLRWLWLLAGAAWLAGEAGASHRSPRGHEETGTGTEEARRQGPAARLKALPELVRGLRGFLRESEQLLAEEPRDATPRQDQEYDFVVVGAGSAGAVVAARLSEAAGTTVLLIEAGDSEHLLMDVPGVVSMLQYSGAINWKYRTEPSAGHCRGMAGRRCKWPRGRVMGGSSVLNFMIASRGNRRDYEQWARELGNAGWSYAEVLPYFRKLERMGVPELRADGALHGADGPVNVEYAPFRTRLAEAFLEAGLGAGFPAIDYNGDRDVGFSYVQATISNGSRVSSNRAYLRPARRRRNLSVARRSRVDRVLVEPTTRRAYGVLLTKAGRGIRVRAAREVILCAGAVGSAQLLMLSGVGPAGHLARMNIDLVQDAPVGENLMDHVQYPGLAFAVDEPLGLRAQDLADPLGPHLGDYVLHRRGPIAVPGGCEVVAFLDVDDPAALSAWPNLELLFVSASLASDFSFRYVHGVADDYWNSYFAGQSRNHTWTALPILLRPKSRGRILLRSKNPAAHPRIYANYLDDPEDVRILVKGIRMVIALSKTKSMQRYNSKLTNSLIKGCESHPYDSDQYWECALRTFGSTLFHPSGTCKMAPDDDPTGVVNPRLQVKGIRGLRVADASIMPTIPAGHTNLPTIMIAEKLSDMVKEDWGLITGNHQ